MSKASLNHLPFWKKRQYYLPLLLLALTNALLYSAMTYRLATKQERLTRELASLTRTVESRKEELKKLVSETERISRNAEMVTHFWTEVLKPREPALTEALAEIDRLARESGVTRGRTSYLYEELDVGITQGVASMPVQGTYFNLIHFINRVELAPRFFLVQQVRLNHVHGNETQLELKCDIAFFLIDDEEGNT